MSKSNKLPLISIGILVIIACMIVIAKRSLVVYEEISIPVMTTDVKLLENDELNESERVVLTMLFNGVSLIDNQSVTEDNMQGTYVEYLEEHLSRLEVDLSRATEDKVVDKIKALTRIINIEKESDVSKMSLDGREIAMYISEQIYMLCGLKLVHNLQGDILQIWDTAGNSLYASDNSLKQVDFQPRALVIILATIAILLTICIIIAKKNQLFKKDGIYNGFNEKAFT